MNATFYQYKHILSNCNISCLIPISDKFSQRKLMVICIYSKSITKCFWFIYMEKQANQFRRWNFLILSYLYKHVNITEKSLQACTSFFILLLLVIVIIHYLSAHIPSKMIAIFK